MVVLTRHDSTIMDTRAAVLRDYRAENVSLWGLGCYLRGYEAHVQVIALAASSLLLAA